MQYSFFKEILVDFKGRLVNTDTRKSFFWKQSKYWW